MSIMGIMALRAQDPGMAAIHGDRDMSRNVFREVAFVAQLGCGSDLGVFPDWSDLEPCESGFDLVFLHLMADLALHMGPHRFFDQGWWRVDFKLTGQTALWNLIHGRDPIYRGMASCTGTVHPLICDDITVSMRGRTPGCLDLGRVVRRRCFLR